VCCSVLQCVATCGRDGSHDSKRLSVPWPPCGCTHKSCHTYEWVMSHVSTSQGTHATESCRRNDWVMSQEWLSHVTLTLNSKSRSGFRQIVFHAHMSHVSCKNASCRIRRWVTSHMCMRHVSCMPCVSSHMRTGHVSYKNGSCLI